MLRALLRSCALAQTHSEADEERHEAELAEAVMQYLSEHPKATDTLEGIAEWWVLRQQVRVDVNVLARVLRRLAERGLLEEIGSGAHLRYSLKNERV